MARLLRGFSLKYKTMKAIKAKADKVIKLSDITDGTLLKRIASAMIREHGYYTYILDNKKVFVS